MRAELAAKFGAEYEAVKATCTRIRNFLRDYDYILINSPAAPKTHRVKKLFSNEWLSNEEAVVYDQKARDIWTNFYKRKLNAYREIDPAADTVPHKLIAQEMKLLYSFGMKDKLDVEFYRVAKKTLITDRFTEDINYARTIFLKTLNLNDVRSELHIRQADHLSLQQIQKERNEMNKTEFETAQPNKEELKELRQHMKLIEMQHELNWKPPTEEDERKMAMIIDELFPLIESKTD